MASSTWTSTATCRPFRPTSLPSRNGNGTSNSRNHGQLARPPGFCLPPGFAWIGAVTLFGMTPRAPKPVLDSSRFGRTPLLFLLALAACCLVAIISLAIVVSQRGPASTSVGLLLALLPIPLLVALILYLDRLEPEPRALLAAIFGAGAGIAVITALLG